MRISACKNRALLLSALTLLLSCTGLFGQVTMTATGTYTQNFNTLATAGTANVFADNSTIPNWYSQRTGTGTTYAADAGSSNAGGLYSYGASGNTDRALGTIGSSNAAAGNFAHGVLLQNTSGSTISDLRVSYALEQWRNSAAAAQSVTFYYKRSNAAITSLNPNANSTWTAVTALNTSSPVTGGTAGAIDGNVNRVTLSDIAIPLATPLAVNEYIMLKWEDPDHSGSDHGLAIDDVSISWTATPPNPVLSSLSPATITAGSGSFLLTVNGSNFVNGLSAILFNGAGRATTFVSPTQLNANIPATDIATAGVVPVTVQTFGAVAASAAVNFTIAAPATPVLSVTSPLSSAFGTICINQNTVTNSFTCNASDLDGSALTLGALPGFAYAESLNGPYASTLTIPYSGGTIANKTIYVQFAPTAVQSYDGTILLSGGGISPVSMAVTGSGINTAATVATGTAVVAGTSATLNGTISAAGCTAVTGYGFEYSTTAGFTPGTGTQAIAANLNTGAFNKSVTGLTGATTYYYRAFATNAAGTVFGNELSFATSSVVPVNMASQPLLRYTESFTDISNWTNNFTSGNGANHFSSVAVNTTGTIPSASRITTSTASFSSGSSGGVQKGSGNIQLLSTGSTDNSSSAAIEFYMDFTGMNAGTLSFDWASVNNSTGDRKGSLRVYASTDGIAYTELASADVLNVTNNVPSTGSVSSVALPASFNNSSTARLRFYYHNGTGGTTGSRPKISIDNLTVTGVAATPCATPAAAPTSLTFAAVAETSVQGSFVAASPAVNEYLVVMSTNPALTSNPLDGVTYNVGDNIGDGVVIDKGTDLVFTASGLTGSTTYYFFVFPVNSVCTGGPKYLTTNVLTDDVTTTAGLPPCSAPAAQADQLVTVAGINSIQGSFAPTAADEYLVLQSSSAVLSVTPVNGVSYSAGTMLGNAVVIQKSAAASFTASSLNPATQYYYFVFSVNSQNCVNGPVYNTVSPLAGSATTLPLPACVTPAVQPSSIAFNASNSSITATFNGSGSGYNYLVVMSSSPTLSATPSDNTDYTAGDALGGGTVVANTTATSFIANNLSASTTYYFFVFAENKNCTGGTKYLVAGPLTGSATTTNAPVYNIYYGTLHSHSDYSDGNKDHPGYTPADDYAYADQSNGMDFLGISEHNHFSSLDNPGNEIANYKKGLLQAAAYNAAHPGFLALYGMEWGVISGGGHVVIFGDGLNDLFGWESNVNGNVGPNYDVYVPKSTYIGSEGLFQAVSKYASINAFATLAHPNNSDYNNLSNIAYDPVADDAIVGTAVESGPSTSTNTTYSNPGSSMFYLWYYQKLLSKGYHLGPTIDHDNHNTTFGRTTQGRTAVLAPSLSQSDIIQSIRDMHFYATEDYDAKVDFSINTRIMGSIFEDRNAPSISVNYTDPTNSTSGALIRVMYGQPGSGVLPVVIDSVFGNTLSYVDNALPNNATGYYYIDITNGTTRIVTSPIWYTRKCVLTTDLNITACDSYNWNGTLYTSSTIATKQFTTTGGCDSTVTLHLTIVSSPATAAISTQYSNTGCPGTGVALNASADGGTGAISTYQWLQNGNVLTVTSAGSFTALSSGAYSVKITDANNCSVTSGIIAVTVADALAPVPDQPELPVLRAACAVTVSQAPTATDNCAGTVTATTTDPLTYASQGTYVIHWTYADGNGNSSVQEQTVIVADNTAPVVTVPQPVSVSADAGTCGATIMVNAPVATDDCAVGTIKGTRSDALQLTDMYPVGTTTITWTVPDIHGNSTVITQTITVSDTQAPVVFTQPVTLTLDASGTASVTAAQVNNQSTDNCGIASVQLNKTAFTCADLGNNTVTLTVTDIHGNTSSAEAVITVVDQIAPTVITKPVTVYLNAAGTASVTATQVNNGSNDNCSIASMTVTPAVFSCANIGNNTVTLTVTDASGNSSSAPATVTVAGSIPSVTITATPSSNTYTGGVPSNLYLGYGPQSVTFNTTVYGGTVAAYSWSGNGILSNTSAAAPVFTPTAAGYYTFTVTVTNTNGCSSSSSVAVCVSDIRVPGSNGKVYVTHNGQTLSISTNAVPAHLAHAGDKLGMAGQAGCTANGTALNAVTQAQQLSGKEAGSATEPLTVTVSPNPSANYFTIRITSTSNTNVQMRVMDSRGRVIESRHSIGANSTLQAGHAYASGTYFAEFTQGTNRKVVQLIKIRQ